MAGKGPGGSPAGNAEPSVGSDAINIIISDDEGGGDRASPQASTTRSKKLTCQCTKPTCGSHPVGRKTVISYLLLDSDSDYSDVEICDEPPDIAAQRNPVSVPQTCSAGEDASEATTADTASSKHSSAGEDSSQATAAGTAPSKHSSLVKYMPMETIGNTNTESSKTVHASAASEASTSKTVVGVNGKPMPAGTSRVQQTVPSSSTVFELEVDNCEGSDNECTNMGDDTVDSEEEMEVQFDPAQGKWIARSKSKAEVTPSVDGQMSSDGDLSNALTEHAGHAVDCGGPILNDGDTHLRETFIPSEQGNEPQSKRSASDCLNLEEPGQSGDLSDSDTTSAVLSKIQLSTEPFVLLERLKFADNVAVQIGTAEKKHRTKKRKLDTAKQSPQAKQLPFSQQHLNNKKTASEIGVSSASAAYSSADVYLSQAAGCDSAKGATMQTQICEKPTRSGGQQKLTKSSAASSSVPFPTASLGEDCGTKGLTITSTPLMLIPIFAPGATQSGSEAAMANGSQATQFMPVPHVTTFQTVGSSWKPACQSAPDQGKKLILQPLLPKGNKPILSKVGQPGVLETAFSNLPVSGVAGSLIYMSIPVSNSGGQWATETVTQPVTQVSDASLEAQNSSELRIASYCSLRDGDQMEHQDTVATIAVSYKATTAAAASTTSSSTVVSANPRSTSEPTDGTNCVNQSVVDELCPLRIENVYSVHDDNVGKIHNDSLASEGTESKPLEFPVSFETLGISFFRELLRQSQPTERLLRFLHAAQDQRITVCQLCGDGVFYKPRLLLNGKQLNVTNIMGILFITIQELARLSFIDERVAEHYLFSKSNFPAVWSAAVCRNPSSGGQSEGISFVYVLLAIDFLLENESRFPANTRARLTKTKTSHLYMAGGRHLELGHTHSRMVNCRDEIKRHPCSEVLQELMRKKRKAQAQLGYAPSPHQVTPSGQMDLPVDTNPGMGLSADELCFTTQWTQVLKHDSNEEVAFGTSMQLMYPACGCLELSKLDLTERSLWMAVEGNGKIENLGVLRFMNRNLFCFLNKGRLYVSLWEMEMRGLLPHDFKSSLSQSLLQNLNKTSNARKLTVQENSLLSQFFPMTTSTDVLTPYGLQQLYIQLRSVDYSYDRHCKAIYYMMTLGHHCDWTLQVTPPTSQLHKVPGYERPLGEEQPAAIIHGVVQQLQPNPEAAANAEEQTFKKAYYDGGGGTPPATKLVSESLHQALLQTIHKFRLDGVAEPFCRCNINATRFHTFRFLAFLDVEMSHVTEMVFGDKVLHCWRRQFGLYVSRTQLKLKGISFDDHYRYCSGTRPQKDDQYRY